MDILLLVGPITSSQYEPVLAAMREQGMKPELVRVGAEFASDGDFYTAAANNLPSNLIDDKADEYADNWVAQKKKSILNAAFGDKSLMDVKGVVFYAENDHYPSHVYMDWLFETLPATHAEHRVHVGEDLQVWIDGDFGRLEPTTSK